MIFWFSGTGNSKWVAGQLGEMLNESLISIADELQKKDILLTYDLHAGEKVILVYPIHSWGPPVIVSQFLQRIDLTGYTDQPVFSVCTCGDDCGYTTEMIAKELSNNGIKLTGSYSVTMPNNYILFPGFDVDKPEKENQKLADAPVRIEEIVKAINGKPLSDLYTRGTVPYIKSRIINPLFVKHVLGKNSFYSTESCISCGLCARICPTQTISMKDQHPTWKNTCIQCLACIHRCPTRAIEYGKITIKKGRYSFPGITTKSI